MGDLRKYARRLIEVDLPIRRISEPASQEKRQGARAHVWWSWKPLSSTRAEIFASAVFDPTDPLCPGEFMREVKRILSELETKTGMSGVFDLATPSGLREDLLELSAMLAECDLAKDVSLLAAAREIVAAAASATSEEQIDQTGLVADPFGGSGSIPIEAARLGLNVCASDLNPVAVFLQEVALIHAPRLGKDLKSLLETWGRYVYDEAYAQIGSLYPRHPGGQPIAYLWLRTAHCTGPGCGALIPLASKLGLAKGARGAALRFRPRSAQAGVAIEIVTSAVDSTAKPTVRLGSATCPVCGFTTPKDKIRAELFSTGAGTKGALLSCVVLTRSDVTGRYFVEPAQADLEAIEESERRLSQISQHSSGLSAIPDELIPNERVWKNNPIRVHLYGMRSWGDLFTARQAVAMNAFASLVQGLPKVMESRGISQPTALSVTACLALAVDRMADHLNSLCTWNASGPKLQHLFSQQVISMVWDFAEANPFGDSVGDWMHAVDCVIEGLTPASQLNCDATVFAADATRHPYPDDSVSLVVTDPPYADQVPYATVSEFFYVWLKRSLPQELVQPFLGEGTPKAEECVVDEARGKDRASFQRIMTSALSEARRITRPNGMAIVMFAHSSTAEWEALLRSVVDAGWIVTASWPLNTELGTRMRAQDSAALASSIHLVCRPREQSRTGIANSGVGDWREVLQELPVRLHEWMPRLTREGIIGADAIFACLGPALEIFTRYQIVEKVSGEPVSLGEYLEQIWAAVSREALLMVFEGAETTGLEADARVSAMWLWTLAGRRSQRPSGKDSGSGSGAERGSAGFVLEFDAARKIAQGLGASLQELDRVVEIEGDKARLRTVAERAKFIFGNPQSAHTLERASNTKQMALFAGIEQDRDGQDWGEVGAPLTGLTTLDRVHQAMILFASGRGDALKRFLVEEGVGHQIQVMMLARALSALYPDGSDEKRWISGVLARSKGLGFG